MTTTPAMNDDLVRELHERAASYRLGGPSSEHTAALLEQAAKEIEALRSALEPFAEIAGEPWANEDGWTEAACQNDRVRDWFGPSAFHAARTALKGA